MNSMFVSTAATAAEPLAIPAVTQPDAGSAVIDAAGLVFADLERGKRIDAHALRAAMTSAFGASDAEGAWDWKSAYDACEAAQVLFLRKFGPAMHARAGSPAALLAMLAKVAALLPSHTRRSEESQALQQFSTPIELGLAASVAAAITSTDLVLEPSAGTGLLAIHAELAGGALVLNELSGRRADLLSHLFPCVAVSRHDAAHIHDHLDAALRPTVVLMNPPFSVAAHVDGRVADAALRHLSSALARLAEGGRLVAITGANLSPDHPSWRDAFVDLQERGRLVFTAAVDGRVYARHGTTIETRLTVIDRVPAEDPTVFRPSPALALVASILASRFGNLLLRSQTQGNDFNSYHVDSLPLWINRPNAALDDAVSWLVRAAKWTSSADIVDRQFDVSRLRVQGSFKESLLRRALEEEPVLAAQLTVETLLERAVFDAYAVSTALQSVTFSELGFPAGWYPLVVGYDSVPELPESVGCPCGLDVLLAKTSKQDVAVKDLSGIRSRLRELYATGAQRGNLEDTAAPVDDVDADTEDDDAALGAAGQAPMPAETFFEEMARALECHPVSICWLLRELRDEEGLVSKAELVRFTEGYVSVLVLRLLGHRWPREIEAGEPPPTWVDGDGVIALTDGPGGKRLLARIRDRLAEDFGRDGVGAIEREFEEIIGRPLGAWLASDFFRRHISQFRKRPIALQIVSSGGNNERRRGRGAGQNAPAFSCLVYYHRLDADLLPKLRTQYVGPLRTSLQTELGSLEKVKERSADQDARRLELEEKLDELKAFAARLDQVIVEGFASAALDRIVAKEPLDRWTSRDGRARPPEMRDAFIAQERRYDPDLNDGVRVNIAPLQRAGLLAADVLTAKNVEKAIADRAEWRADERRWCREGKLPRPGWWLEDVAEVKMYSAHVEGAMATTEGRT